MHQPTHTAVDELLDTFDLLAVALAVGVVAGGAR